MIQELLMVNIINPLIMINHLLLIIKANNKFISNFYIYISSVSDWVKMRI
jgi:hypothetical protein